MALIKKIDVEKHFAARRAMRLGRIGLFSQSAAAVTEQAGKPANVPRVTPDRTGETSSPSASSAAIPIALDSGRNRLLRPPGSRHE
jgi:hypothetical protein